MKHPRIGDYPGEGPMAPAILRGLACGVALGLLGLAPAHAGSSWSRDGNGNALSLRGSDAANAVLMRAIGLIGTPYVWGGNTPENGFDCSGLVNYVYDDMLALRLPRTSRELAAWQQGASVDPSELASGDLVFFGSEGTVSHVGIYVGEGRFVHAPRTGATVRLDRLDGAYWTARYLGARRVL